MTTLTPHQVNQAVRAYARLSIGEMRLAPGEKLVLPQEVYNKIAVPVDLLGKVIGSIGATEAKVSTPVENPS